MTQGVSEDQSAVVDLLMEPRSYAHRPEGVTRIDTHGAMIFLAGDRAYKLKRAVKLAYLDFSTVEKRRAVCEREMALNSVTAPGLYLGVLPVARVADGVLRLGGEGEAADWVIEMRRFDQTQLFDRLAEAGRLDMALIEKLGGLIAQFHEGAEAATGAAWPESLGQVLLTVTRALGADEFASLGLGDLPSDLDGAFRARETLMTARRNAGFVRRCHGDMHLKNIVLLDGEPRLFDALEFDENLARIDVLYDLAFLFMDLWRRGLKAEANAVLNRYFGGTASAADLAGLALLPLFLALRAGVRAMVGLDGLAVAQGTASGGLREETHGYARLAKALIAPTPARLLAIGGLSGTGKTTVARGLAPTAGPAPGAIVLRSDVERKAMFGAAPEERLDASAYSEAATTALYARLMTKAEAALRAGHAVILDATFQGAEHRGALQALSRRVGLASEGVWLTATLDARLRRVRTRHGDASDADAAIVMRQALAEYTPPQGWLAVDAGGDAAATVALAASALGLN
jgi:aminoglycoside phosphotransferase family enzyme/predicted kinase